MCGCVGAFQPEVLTGCARLALANYPKRQARAYIQIPALASTLSTATSGSPWAHLHQTGTLGRPYPNLPNATLLKAQSSVARSRDSTSRLELHGPGRTQQSHARAHALIMSIFGAPSHHQQARKGSPPTSLGLIWGQFITVIDGRGYSNPVRRSTVTDRGVVTRAALG